MIEHPPLTIRAYQPASDAEDLLALYERYSAELNQFGPAGFDRDDPWWNRPQECRTIVAAHPGDLGGFLMVGYGEQVDDDVASEVCEAYVVPRWRGRGVLRRMFEAAVPLLREPWGFQVLVSNPRMWRCPERWLTQRSIDFVVREAVDDGARVRKYRPTECR